MLHTDDIWAELTRRRIKAKEIAIDLGVATSTVTRAINGETRTPAPTILEDVAARIGVGVEELSPGRPSRLAQNHTEKSSIGSTSKSHRAQTPRPGLNEGQRSGEYSQSTVYASSGGASRTSEAVEEAA
ncbi:MAG: helix-turn-helix domain-containing protein [Desulfarculaceae bacterium]|nr:helix-turn-helix domain-containing protein [Desulfarculaceae bacterium]MCF8097408.1 helix-turn-helix domain-containing protein [Desulfarculaceae bacterium]MCF8123832.1 helix-turn-helix domain-containing protein [Desulfarculaceae bacterium]